LIFGHFPLADSLMTKGAYFSFSLLLVKLKTAEYSYGLLSSGSGSISPTEIA